MMQLKKKYQDQEDLSQSPEKAIQVATSLEKLSEEAKDLLALIFHTPTEFEELLFSSDGTFHKKTILNFFKEILKIRLSKKYIPSDLSNLCIINNEAYPAIVLSWLDRKKTPTAQTVMNRTMKEIKVFCQNCDII